MNKPNDKFTWQDGDIEFVTEKANPYHDERGRFSEGQGGGGQDATTKMLEGDGWSLHHTDDEGNKVYQRGGRGFIVAMTDGSWQSSEGGHGGKGQNTLQHFLLLAWASHMGGPQYYKPPTNITDDVGKFNPSHDERGRFASAGGASAGLDAAISSALKDKGGFTFNPVTVTAPHHGFAVGGYGTRDAYDAGKFTVANIRDYLKRNKEALKENFLGGWIDKGKVYLDVTKVFPKAQRAAAVAAGKVRDQIAIADLEALNAGRMDEAFIDTGGTGKAVPAVKRTAFLLDPRAMTAEEMHAALMAMIAQLK